MRFVFIALILAVAVGVSGCGSKKVIVKECEKAGNVDLYICEKL